MRQGPPEIERFSSEGEDCICDAAQEWMDPMSALQCELYSFPDYNAIAAAENHMRLVDSASKGIKLGLTDILADV